MDDLKAKEKRGFSKEQKEELACAEKVRDFVLEGKDVRYVYAFTHLFLSSLHHHAGSPTRLDCIHERASLI